ncbi:MAG: 5'/3'-nucleotidase SurE [Firmicutes bacterium]|jgi:5'-nucleotidase|nr:5'/3'-nucleotidase SurE [Bacillota bacterium]HPU01754.1 5'/3'-nucleotidase SurE [Bacillota bacterium]
MAENLLITNDDGIYAEGIQLLSQVLFDSGRYKLAVVAPDHERSAVGHAITMHRPLRVEQVSFLHNPALSGWAVNGTPSDCVKLAVEALLEERPSLIISGINRGSNLGTDVLYSGTVSAAVEGIILGIPSVAVSLTERGRHEDYIFAAEFVRDLIPHLLEEKLPAGTLLNINVPADRNAVKGVRVTRLGTRRYRNCFDRRTDPRGMIYYWLAGELVEGEEEEDSDVWAVREGYISMTPVQFNLTNEAIIPHLEKMVARMGMSGRQK